MPDGGAATVKAVIIVPGFGESHSFFGFAVSSSVHDAPDGCAMRSESEAPYWRSTSVSSPALPGLAGVTMPQRTVTPGFRPVR